MWLNPQIPADLVTFTEEILNGKLHCLCNKDSLLNFKQTRFYSILSYGTSKYMLFNYVLAISGISLLNILMSTENKIKHKPQRHTCIPFKVNTCFLIVILVYKKERSIKIKQVKKKDGRKPNNMVSRYTILKNFHLNYPHLDFDVGNLVDAVISFEVLESSFTRNRSTNKSMVFQKSPNVWCPIEVSKTFCKILLSQIVSGVNEIAVVF